MKWILLLFSPILLLGAGITGLYFMIPEFIKNVVKFLTKSIIVMIILHQFYRIISWYFDIPNFDLTLFVDFCSNHQNIIASVFVITIFLYLLFFMSHTYNKECKSEQYPTVRK